MKSGDKVLIPQGWFPNGQERPMTEVTITGFKRHEYSNRKDGQPDVVIVKDDSGTFMLSVDSVEVRS